MPSHEGNEQPPIINITGERVALGPHRREYLPLYQRWINDFETTRNLGMPLRPITLEAETAWYENTVKGSERDAVFTIYVRETLRPIGSTGLHEIDYHHGTATFGILIGEKDCWNKGYGTETARLMLDYGFNALGLHNIMLQVFAYNARGITAYLRAGYKEIGRRRAAVRVGGRRHDIILMDCLATEFDSPVLRQVLAGP